MLVVELAGRASPVLLLCRDIPNCQDENRSLCASACARVKLLFSISLHTQTVHLPLGFF